MNELLQEYVSSQGLAVRVDRQQGVVQGVKILGLESRNGRSYLPDALARAAALYEGAKVNVNHPKGDLRGPRDYQDRIGSIRQVVLREGQGLFADFHFNPKHALAEQLAWDAEHAPENVGFSHNVEARTSRRGETTVVEEILKVQSVDLVADPATSRGLFESADPRAQWLAALVPDDLRAQRPDLVEALAAESAARAAQLQIELDQLRAAEAARGRRAAVRRLLAEFHLPDPDSRDPGVDVLLGPRFLQSLEAAEDEATVRTLIEERARLVDCIRHSAAGGRQPVSRDQHQVDLVGPADAKAFAAAICQR